MSMTCASTDVPVRVPMGFLVDVSWCLQGHHVYVV